MGKAERQARAKEGCTWLEKVHWSEADECSYAEEIVDDDEGKVGGENEESVTDECLRTTRTFAGACSPAGVLWTWKPPGLMSQRIGSSK